jgi:hypothetical protein
MTCACELFCKATGSQCVVEKDRLLELTWHPSISHHFEERCEGTSPGYLDERLSEDSTADSKDMNEGRRHQGIVIRFLETLGVGGR